jgi:DNA-binding NarL/FixJ family response regulator
MTGPRDAKASRAGGAAAPRSDASRPLRVLVVDDHLLARSTTRRQLQEMPDLQVVGEATDGFEAVALARTLSPDLVLMDISMPGLDGIEATRRITAEFPRVRVVILSSHEEETFQRSAQKAGAVGYVLKGGTTERLAAAVQRIFGSL